MPCVQVTPHKERERDLSMEEERSVRGRGSSKWKTLKEILGFKTIACCVSMWGPHRNPQNGLEYREERDRYYQEHETIRLVANPSSTASSTIPMNLAAALAAERSQSTCGEIKNPMTEEVLYGESEISEWWQCVICMGREKGAAFIPCGHSFCRVCANEVWVSRGTCPLCNQSIVEILQIF